jgi:hypothetical protein
MIIVKIYALCIMLMMLGIISYLRYIDDTSIDLRNLLIIILVSLIWPIAIVFGFGVLVTDTSLDTPTVIKSRSESLKAREDKIRKKKERLGYDV